MEDEGNEGCETACGPTVEAPPEYKMRSICINPALNGFICRVGCQTVIFEDRTRMLHEIERYIDNPLAVENEYLEKHSK